MTDETLEKIRNEYDRIDHAIDNLERIIEKHLSADEVQATDNAMNDLVGGKNSLEQFITDAEQTLADAENEA